MTAPQIFSAISPSLGSQILEDLYSSDRKVYKLALNAAAQAKKLRPVFLERQARPERHRVIVSALSRPDQALVAGNLLSGWLVQHQVALLTDFLNALGITHEKGVVQDLPETVEDAKIDATLEQLLARYPAEVVSVYLNAFYTMNEANWPHLELVLKTDPRLTLGQDTSQAPVPPR